MRLDVRIIMMARALKKAGWVRSQMKGRKPRILYTSPLGTKSAWLADAYLKMQRETVYTVRPRRPAELLDGLGPWTNRRKLSKL